MQFPTLPPEINTLRMLSGAGSGPMMQAAQAWQSLGNSLRSASSSFQNVTSNLAGGAWQGAAAQAMTQAAAPYVAWLTAAAAHSETAALQSQLVASAFEAARAMTVPLQSISGNRNSFISAIRANIFGQLTPAIMALEGMYEEMWAQDVSAIAGYHAGASSSAGALAPLAQLMSTLPGMLSGLSGAAAPAASSGAVAPMAGAPMSGVSQPAGGVTSGAAAAAPGVGAAAAPASVAASSAAPADAAAAPVAGSPAAGAAAAPVAAAPGAAMPSGGAMVPGGAMAAMTIAQVASQANNRGASGPAATSAPPAPEAAAAPPAPVTEEAVAEPVKAPAAVPIESARVAAAPSAAVQAAPKPKAAPASEGERMPVGEPLPLEEPLEQVG
jgi:hypothetical protein